MEDKDFGCEKTGVGKVGSWLLEYPGEGVLSGHHRTRSHPLGARWEFRILELFCGKLLFDCLSEFA
jgi:hypothetical protein